MVTKEALQGSLSSAGCLFVGLVHIINTWSATDSLRAGFFHCQYFPQRRNRRILLSFPVPESRYTTSTFWCLSPYFSLPRTPWVIASELGKFLLGLQSSAQMWLLRWRLSVALPWRRKWSPETYCHERALEPNCIANNAVDNYVYMQVFSALQGETRGEGWYPINPLPSWWTYRYLLTFIESISQSINKEIKTCRGKLINVRDASHLKLEGQRKITDYKLK